MNEEFFLGKYHHAVYPGKPRSALADCDVNLRDRFPTRKALCKKSSDNFSFLNPQVPKPPKKTIPDDFDDEASINLKIARPKENPQNVDLRSMLPTEFSSDAEYLRTYMTNLFAKDIELFFCFGTRENLVTYKAWAESATYVTKIHAACNYPSYLLCQNLKILNGYLQKKKVRGKDLTVAAIASMWISAKKYNTAEPKIPPLQDLITYLPQDIEDKRDSLLSVERDILKVLDFNIAFPDSHSIVAYFLITENIPNACDVFYCSSYMIDLSLQDKSLVVQSSVELAIAALQIGLFIVSKKGSFDFEEISKLVFDCYAFVVKKSVLEFNNFLKKELMFMAFISKQEHSSFGHVYKKYSRSIYGRVSRMIDLLDVHDYEKFLNL